MVLLLIGSLVARAQKIESVINTADSLILVANYDEAQRWITAQLIHLPAYKDLLYNRLAETRLGQGDINEAERILNELASDAGVDEQQKAIYLTNLGALYQNKGRNDLAIESLQKAFDVFRQQGETASRDMARCLSLLSLTYSASGKYSQAEEYGVIALQMRQQLFGNEHEVVAASYNDLGLVYSLIDPDKALAYYDLALPIYQKLHGSSHPKIAIVNGNMGALYIQLKLYGDAIANFESALDIWKNIYPNGHPNEAFVLRNLGRTYVLLGNHATAHQYFVQALEQYRRAYGEKHPDIASTLNQIALLEITDQQFAKSLASVQDAICANIPQFNSKDVFQPTPLHEYYNSNVLLYSLQLKAKAFEEMHYGRSLKFSDLKYALWNLQRCDSLIDDIRHHSTDESDKLSLGSLASEVYEAGVRVAFAMSEMTLDSKIYREVAFYFAEKSKSAVLQESIADAQAKSFSGIPTELLNEEKELKSAIAFLNQKLSQKPTANEEKYLRETLFQLNNDYASFTKKLERDYPNYYNLKFNYSSPTVSEVQKALTEKQGVLSFFIDEKFGRIYQFSISQKNFTIRNLTLPKGFERAIKGMVNGIYYRDVSALAKGSNELRKVLVPRFPPSINELIIIPAGRLGTLPFEALPVDALRDDIGNSKFLVDRFAISYEFSAGLMLQKNKAMSGVASPSIFLCAPIEFSPSSNLNDLPGTESEVNTIAQLFGSGQKKLLKKEEANEAFLKTNALGSYNYLHFATHGVVDEADPELSRIFLNTGGGEDGNLFAGEIYNLSLNADLAVLSACQTGLGKYSKGEGVIGLSRALVYAGARNLVVSFWSVSDESTSRLMTDFYTILLSQQTPNFRLALQQAKRKMIQEKRYTEPYFWAPFVLIGF